MKFFKSIIFPLISIAFFGAAHPAFAASDQSSLVKALHLNGGIAAEDVSSQLSKQDGVYASIPQGDSIRVTFDKALASQNDITLYGVTIDREHPSSVEIYPVYDGKEGNKLSIVGDGSNPDFSSITTYGKYRSLLKNLSRPTDTFDLKVRGGPLKIDYVVDPSLTVLHNFTGSAADGSQPYGSLIASGSTLYGMTLVGGSDDVGMIFSVQTNGTGFTDLHDFTESLTDGAYPYGAFTLSGSTLYGMTFNGGTDDDGIIFSIQTNGTGFTDLHDFTGSSTDGSGGNDLLVLSGGTLYGITVLGGANDEGIVFSMGTDGSNFTDLHDFTSGAEPYGSLVLSGSTLYGMTYRDGSHAAGTIFSIGTNGSGFSVLHNFAGGTDGGQPNGTLIISGSTLYGMTTFNGSAGKGIIFSMQTNGTGFTNLHNFTGTPSDGEQPWGYMSLSGGTLYGMTRIGGSTNNGMIFSVGTDGTNFTNLHDFLGTDGSGPQGSLLLSGSTLYGMTTAGGTSSDGVIFSYALSVPDSTPPSTSASASPYTFGTTTQNDVHVTLTCNDGSGSGCSTTYYCLDSHNTCTPSTIYSTPVLISSSGTSFIRYYSVDANANSETATSSTILIQGAGGGGSGGSSTPTNPPAQPAVTPPATPTPQLSPVVVAQITNQISIIAQQIRNLSATPPSARAQVIQLINQAINLILQQIKGLVGK